VLVEGREEEKVEINAKTKPCETTCLTFKITRGRKRKERREMKARPKKNLKPRYSHGLDISSRQRLGHCWLHGLGFRCVASSGAGVALLFTACTSFTVLWVEQGSSVFNPLGFLTPSP